MSDPEKPAAGTHSDGDDAAIRVVNRGADRAGFLVVDLEPFMVHGVAARVIDLDRRECARPDVKRNMANLDAARFD